VPAKGLTGITIEVDKSEIKGILMGGYANTRQLTRHVRRVAMITATRVADIAKSRLEIGGRKNIGATGRAATNIFVRQSGDDAMVYEGSYPGNYYIRYGRGSTKKPPPIQSIVDWMVNKPGFNFNPQKSQALRWTKSGGPRANLRSRPSRPFKRDLKDTAQAISAKIGKTGLVHLKKYHPVGQPRYDYYSEMFTRTPGIRHFNKLIAKEQGEFLTQHIRFLRDGHEVKGGFKTERWIG